MTTYNKASLKTFFETNDIPTGTDYANLIDSYVNLVETSVQAMAGNLQVPKIIVSRVSASNLNCYGVLSASTGYISNLAVDGVFSVTSAASFAGKVSANALNVATDVSANTGTVYASAMRSINGVFQGVGIVSAAGTAQATAAPLANIINQAKGVVDGSTTGFAIPANRTGLTQIIYNDSVSANLWPPTGGTINALGANAAFSMAASTPYAIYHIAASAYAVK